MILYNYIDYLGAYRLYDSDHPDQNIAILNAEDLALVLLEDPDGDKYGGETNEDFRAFMRRLMEKDRTARDYTKIKGLWYENHAKARKK